MTVAQAALCTDGFQRWNLTHDLDLDDLDRHYADLVTEFEDLPQDPYLSEPGRYRRYARGMYLPWTNSFSWIPATPGQSVDGMNGYYQGAHNPEFVNVVRELPAIKQSALENPLLQSIIAFDYEQTQWGEADSCWPIHVGVHLIKLSVDDGGEAVSSPNELHQDGEPFVFAHLMYRRNARGGGNVVALPRHRGRQPDEVPPADVIAEFELSRPLESYGIHDHLVSHYVAPVRQDSDSAPGERAVILTDFVPMRQSI